MSRYDAAGRSPRVIIEGKPLDNAVVRDTELTRARRALGHPEDGGWSMGSAIHEMQDAGDVPNVEPTTHPPGTASAALVLGPPHHVAVEFGDRMLSPSGAP